ncbi:MAG TPA: hypothetical protein VLL27_15080 [Solirubrobacterales bacterium]|nr:hypothetical protein [Solirubrobacterales bacterium]
MEGNVKSPGSRLRRRGGMLVLAGLAAMSAFVGSASAAPARRASAPQEPCPIAHVELNVTYSCSVEFTLHGSDGYRITVSGDPGGGGADQVRLITNGPSGSAEYSVKGSVTTTSVQAVFGRLGRVSVRFRPSGVSRRIRVPRRCMKGRPAVVTSRLGSFSGAIEFRGERDYTHVSTRRAWGGIGDPLANTAKKLACEFHESDAERKKELESVSLDGSPTGSGVTFTAFRAFGSWSGQGFPGGSSSPKDSQYVFVASAIERAGKMFIVRYTGALGGADDFVFDDALTTATVAPPVPFTGRGSFLRNVDGSTSWTGDLSVPLPGLGTVRLTGGGADLATVADHLKHLEEELNDH